MIQGINNSYLRSGSCNLFQQITTKTPVETSGQRTLTEETMSEREVEIATRRMLEILLEVWISRADHLFSSSQDMDASHLDSGEV